MARYQRHFYVEVDDNPVQVLIDLVNRAVGPASLAVFLETDAHIYFAEEMELRFAYEGDRKSGSWPWLSPTTQRIREEQGFPGASPINVRTGGLEDFVTNHYDLDVDLSGAELNIPGDPPSSTLEQKLKTAQQGRPDNPIPGFGPTPPRPVLAFDEMDLAVLLERLQAYIVSQISLGLG